MNKRKKSNIENKKMQLVNKIKFDSLKRITKQDYF